MTCDHCGCERAASRFFSPGLCFGCAAVLLRKALAGMGITTGGSNG